MTNWELLPCAWPRLLNWNEPSGALPKDVISTALMAVFCALPILRLKSSLVRPCTALGSLPLTLTVTVISRVAEDCWEHRGAMPLKVTEKRAIQYRSFLMQACFMAKSIADWCCLNSR